jgi:hypothetical protein
MLILSSLRDKKGIHWWVGKTGGDHTALAYGTAGSGNISW